MNLTGTVIFNLRFVSFLDLIVVLVCIFSCADVLFEDQAYLNSQSGTSRLDKFTHCLLIKCNVEVGPIQPISKPSMKTIETLSCWYSFDSSHRFIYAGLSPSDEYLCARVCYKYIYKPLNFSFRGQSGLQSKHS